MDGLEYFTGKDGFAYLAVGRHDLDKVLNTAKAAVSLGARVWADESCSPLNAASLERLKNCSQCLVFLSRKSVCSHAFRSTLTAAVEMEKPITAVYLEKTELTLCQRLQIARTEIVDCSDIASAEDMARRLFSEGVFDKCCEKPVPPRETCALIRLSNGECIPITGKEFSIGRSECMTDHTVSGNSAISRLHIVIRQTGKGYAVIDQNSLNKTYINGSELTPMVEYPIKPGDEIALADEKFKFRLGAER